MHIPPALKTNKSIRFIMFSCHSSVPSLSSSPHPGSIERDKEDPAILYTIFTCPSPSMETGWLMSSCEQDAQARLIAHSAMIICKIFVIISNMDLHSNNSHHHYLPIDHKAIFLAQALVLSKHNHLSLHNVYFYLRIHTKTPILNFHTTD